MRFAHIGEYSDRLDFFLGVWRHFIALAVDLECPVLKFSEEMVFVRGETSCGPQELTQCSVDFYALVDAERRGHPVDVFEGRHNARYDKVWVQFARSLKETEGKDISV